MDASADPANNLIINDLLCFIHNNISSLNCNTLCRMCLETYSSNDILQACSLLNNVVHANNTHLDDAPVISDQMTTEEKTIRAMLYVFRQQNISNLPKFVSHGLHLPKMTTFYDNSFLLPLLEEMQDLKQSFIEKQKLLHSEITALRQEIASMKATPEPEKNTRIPICKIPFIIVVYLQI